MRKTITVNNHNYYISDIDDFISMVYDELGYEAWRWIDNAVDETKLYVKRLEDAIDKAQGELDYVI